MLLVCVCARMFAIFAGENEREKDGGGWEEMKRLRPWTAEPNIFVAGGLRSNCVCVSMNESECVCVCVCVCVCA